MAGEIVGREEELASLHAWLDQARDEPRALVLEGEAGIGKSMLWLAALEMAQARGLRVLSSRPVQAERGYAFAGLGDVFEDVVEEVLPSLPGPRRRALEVALLVEQASGTADPRALGVAVRNALEVLAGNGPLVVAVDDVQWLDRSSASALAFAFRRLSEPVVLLLTRRSGEGIEPSEIEQALARDSVERLPVGPLSVGAMQRLLQGRLDRVFARPTLLRIHETSGGNPFYALELARALGRDVDPTRPLPVPESLEALVDARLGRLPEATQEALVLVSAQARLTPAQLGEAGIVSSALDLALREHVIEFAHGTVRFTHPLLASVLYQRLSASERQRAHRCLAELVEDPLGRARHLALSTDGPDAVLAAAVEQAAAAADIQGAPIVAAELGEHALRLTPAENRADVDRRAIAAARAHRAAGEVERGRVLAGDLAARALAGAERAEALALMAEMESEEPRRAIPLLNEALLQAAAPPALQASIHQQLSLIVRFTEGLAAAERHARASVELAARLEDTPLRAAALAGLALIRFNAGKPGALRLAEQAYGLASDVAASQPAAEAGFALAHILLWSVHLERARVLLESLYRDWSERDERIAAHALWYLALVELRSGRLSLAGEYAEQARDLSALYARDEAESPQNLLPMAVVAAHRGELERARELAERMCRLAELHASRLSMHTATLGVVELWSGDAGAAVARFAAAERTADAPDATEPGMCWWRAEQVEALLELGLVDDAVDRLETWDADARRLRRHWALAHTARCRGLVAAARGEVERAVSLFAEATSQHEAAGDPFGRARALLALGVARRRMRQKRAARQAIEEAVAIFEECGAGGWAEKARSELGRIGGRRREQGLTPAEQRVAALVAEGRTNREVAAALFLGEGTVETHLSHIYAKLGVRSRTELARTLG